jgi:hypothetical protein
MSQQDAVSRRENTRPMLPVPLIGPQRCTKTTDWLLCLITILSEKEKHATGKYPSIQKLTENYIINMD